MSKKWRENKAWEDEHLTGALTPLRLVLRAFSSIPLAVVLLTFVSVYAALASVPIGIIALLPTWLVYAATFLLATLVPAGIAVFIVRLITRSAGVGVRFALSLGALIGIAVPAAVIWHRTAWPALHYDPATGAGLMFFADFIEQYKSVTVRRLPAMEMTETQFYAWWPMRLALVLFVINMVVATIRRIEFTFKNLGVLSVHSGIVMIAVGSVYYQNFKEEGDTLLMAGTSGTGPPARYFYDREDVALYVGQRPGLNGSVALRDVRPLWGVPRYNDYNMNAGQDGYEFFSERPIPGMPAVEPAPPTDGGRTLDIPVPGTSSEQRILYVDPDIDFRVVGYAGYAELQPDWVKTDPPSDPTLLNPMRTVELYAELPGSPNDPTKPVFEFPFFLGDPSERIRSNDIVAMEFTRDMDEDRWNDLGASIPIVASHALVVEIPGTGFRAVFPASVGDRFSLGDSGWSVGVKDLADEPPFPIITPGFEGATSSLAILELTPPDGPAVDRWVYHRFPELNQDLGTTPDPVTGRPSRTAPDPRIRVSYLDMTRLQVYLDEREDQTVRAIVRQPGGQVVVTDDIPAGDAWLRNIVPNEDGATIDLHLAERWSHAQKVQRPIPTPELERDNSHVGHHTYAKLAVEVSIPETSPGGPWSEVVWLPFVKYVGSMDQGGGVPVTLPDGRTVRIAFGRLPRGLPAFTVSLVEFEMISYDHRGAPRDFQSIVRVEPTLAPDDGPNFEPFEHLVKLNAPLRAPFHWNPEASIISNTIKRLQAGLNPRQFKLSQAGWDRAGWQQSQEMVDQGLLDEPRATFTILGVGNNPGIHVIALGSVIMGLGIPWAFYIKPWLVKREKQRIAAAVEAGTYQPPAKQSNQHQKTAKPTPESSEVPA